MKKLLYPILTILLFTFWSCEEEKETVDCTALALASTDAALAYSEAAMADPMGDHSALCDAMVAAYQAGLDAGCEGFDQAGLDTMQETCGNGGGEVDCVTLVTAAIDALMAYATSMSTEDCEAANAAIQAVIDGGCDIVDEDPANGIGDLQDAQGDLPCGGDGDDITQADLLGTWEGANICGYTNSDCIGDCVMWGDCVNEDGYNLDVEDAESCATAGGTWEPAVPQGVWLTFNEDNTVSEPAYCASWDGTYTLMEDSTQCEGFFNAGGQIGTYAIDGSTVLITVMADEGESVLSCALEADGTLRVNVETPAECNCDDEECDDSAADSAENEESCAAINGASWDAGGCIGQGFQK